MHAQPDVALGAVAAAVLTGNITRIDPIDHLAAFEFAGGRLWLSAPNATVGNTQQVRILARDVAISLQPPQQSTVLNVLPATVLDLHADHHPAQQLVRLQVGPSVLLSRITRRSAQQLHLGAGLRVYAWVKSVAVDSGL